MSQSTDSDAASIGSTNGFWEIGNYKANVQRIHQGSDQLEDIGRFIKDRIAIESTYSKNLEKWNEEWAGYSDKHLKEGGGTLKSSFDMLLEESRELAKVHHAIKERFNDEVLKTIELFKRDNYHKSTFRGFKEAKEIEDEFEKAQKQWKKLYEKVESAKRAYHGMARAEKSAYIQFMNSKSDPSIADSASDKCKERFEKCQEEVKRAKSNYEQQVKEATSYNSIYMENMAFVFEKCQRMEMKRLRFIVEMLSGMEKILVDLLNPPKLVQLHDKLRQHFLMANDAALGEDLKRWSLKHGVDCGTKWPEFEEYAGEFRPIHTGSGKSKQRQQQGMAGGGVVLTKKVVKSEEEDGQRRNGGGGGMEWRRAMGTSQSSNCSEPTATGGWGTADEDGGGGGENGSGGGKFVKQNSIDSQQSRATSKSSRSQSEKPPPRSTTNLAGNQPSRFQQGRRHPPQQQQISNPQQPIEKFNSSARPPSTMSAVPLDPLASDTFPMVTPQKGSEEQNAANGGRAEFQQPLDFGAGKRATNGEATVVVGGGQEDVNVQKESAATTIVGQPEAGADNQLPAQMPVGPAKVLYDYKPYEDDEIQLVKGEVLQLLSGPDHLGWCLGVKKNKERGLFPAAYVCPLIQ